MRGLEHVKSSILYGASSVISKATGFIVVPIIAENVALNSFGVMDFIISGSLMFSFLVALCLESAVMRFWHLQTDDSYRQQLVSSSLALITLFGGSLLFLLLFFSKQVSFFLFDSSEYHLAVSLALITAWFQALGTIPLMALRMQDRAVEYCLITLVQSLTYAIFTLYFLKVDSLGIISVFYGTLWSRLISIIYSVYYVRSLIGFSINKDCLKECLSFSIPLIPAIFVTWFSTYVDRALLAQYTSFEEVGRYGAATRLTLLLTIPIFAFRQVWLPQVMKVIESNNKLIDARFRDTLKIYFLAGICCIAVINFFKSDLMVLLFPTKYHSGTVVIPWLLGANLLSGSFVIAGIGIAKVKKTVYNSAITISGAVLNAILGWLLIPIYGLSGAAIGSFTSSAVSLLLFCIVSNRLDKFNFHIGSIIVFILILSLMSFF